MHAEFEFGDQALQFASGLIESLHAAGVDDAVHDYGYAAEERCHGSDDETA